jgi:hypothetical protein
MYVMTSWLFCFSRPSPEHPPPSNRLTFAVEGISVFLESEGLPSGAQVFTLCVQFGALGPTPYPKA